jgi:hypothetical protein
MANCESEEGMIERREMRCERRTRREGHDQKYERRGPRGGESDTAVGTSIAWSVLERAGASDGLGTHGGLTSRTHVRDVTFAASFYMRLYTDVQAVSYEPSPFVRGRRLRVEDVGNAIGSCAAVTKALRDHHQKATEREGINEKRKRAGEGKERGGEGRGQETLLYLRLPSVVVRDGPEITGSTRSGERRQLPLAWNVIGTLAP